VTVAKV